MSKLSFSVLRLPDFRRLMGARGFAVMALQAQDVIVGWQIYSLTKSTLLLGLTGLVEALAAISCALIAGHIVDTHRPHTVFRLVVGLLMLDMLGLLLVGGGMVPVAPSLLVSCLFVGVFLSGIRSFIMPSAFVLLSRVVSRTELPSASAWFSSVFQIAAIASPAITGVVYGAFGVRAAWCLPVSFFAVSLLLLGRFSHAIRLHKTDQLREGAVKSIRAGWRFVWENQTLLSVMALDMFAVLFGGAIAMLPAYADQVLHVGAAGLGALRASPAIGAIVTALFLALRPLKTLRGSMLLAVVAGFGLCIIAFGLSTSFALSLLFLACSGAFDSVSMVIRGTLMQLLTPDAMRGRISALGSMFIISSNEIGAFESGLAATLFGLVPSVVLGGALTLVVVGVTAVISPRLRKATVSSDHPSPL